MKKHLKHAFLFGKEIDAMESKDMVIKTFSNRGIVS